MSLFFNRVDSAVAAKVLCFADNTRAAEVNKAFLAYMRIAMKIEWQAMAKDEVLKNYVAQLVQEGGLNPDVNIGKCFAALFSQQKEESLESRRSEEAYRFLLENCKNRFSLERFKLGLDALALMDAERAQSLHRSWPVIRQKLEHAGHVLVGAPAYGAGAEEIRQWMEIPENRELLKSITHLVLRVQGLSILPRELLYLENLYELDITRNQLRCLPRFLAKLSNLTYIEATNNPLHHIAPELVHTVIKPSGFGEKSFGIDLQYLEEIPFQIWFRHNCTIPRIWEPVTSAIFKNVPFAECCPINLFVAIATALVFELPVFLINLVLVGIIEPVIRFIREILGFSPTIKAGRKV